MSNKHPRQILLAVTFTLATTLVHVVASPARQSQPSLQITSPTSGIIVSPGGNVSVTVTSPAGLTFSQVDVVGEQPIGMSTIATTIPAQFTLSIPPNIACGTLTIFAEGMTSTSQDVQSAPITIDVERSDLPASLSASTSTLLFEVQGQQSSLEVFATYFNGAILRVTESSYVAYASSNNSVATVDTEGNVTAVAAGTASITVTYTLGSQNLQFSIPVTVQNPMLTTSPSSLTFTAQSIGTSSAPQPLTLTNTASSAVTVLNIAANSDFSESDNCISSSPLPVNANCTVNVSFTPTGAGARTGTLTIANSANNVPIIVSLTGTGTAAPPPTIALVQHTSVDSEYASSLTLSFGSNNNAGNFVGVVVRAGSSGEVITVTDSNGNTYKKAIQLDVTLDTPEGHTLAIYYAENIAGGPNTVTVSDTVYATLRFAILEYSGVATSQSLDVTAAAQGSSTAADSGSATTTTNGELLLGGFSTADAEDLAAGTGYTFEEAVPAEPTSKLIAEDQVQTTAGSISASGSLVDYSDPWGAVLATFKAAGR